MKNRNKFVCALVLSLGALAGLASCGGSEESSSSRNPEIAAVYQAYVNNGGTLTYEEWLATVKGEKGDKGADGKDGKDGTNGTDGKDGLTPKIGDNGNWWIGETDTGVKAEGKDGSTPAVSISEDGYWVINGEKTEVKAKGEKGDKGDTGADGKKGDKGDKGDTGATGRIGFVAKDAEDLKVAATIDNAYIVLAKDISVDSIILATADVVIDLNGKTLTSTVSNDPAFYSYGKDADVLVKNGKIVSTASSGLAAYDHATLTVEDGLEVTAQESCLVAFDYGNLVINGGTYNSIDNFVIGTNGTVDEEHGVDLGHNTITVNGGTFNGKIATSGYIACGIYVANSDTVNVNGGTFNIENGVGVLARSGKTYVSENVKFNLTSTQDCPAGGYVGDNKNTIPVGKAVVQDLIANYPGGTPTVDAPKTMVYVLEKD